MKKEFFLSFLSIKNDRRPYKIKTVPKKEIRGNKRIYWRNED